MVEQASRASVRERRVVVATGVVLVVVAALAWVSLAAAPLGGSVMAPSPSALFLVTWVLMTVAMMIPATLPVLLLHRLQSARAGAGPLPTLAFLGGYLLPWAGGGVAALALVSVAGGVAGALMVPPAVVGALALLVAGLYQLTPVKSLCLTACRSPLTVLFDVRARDRLVRHAAVGARHGAWCLACCWSLMAVLVVASLMSVAWMAALTAVFLLEKAHPRGPAVARAAGVLIILLGGAGLVHPELLTWLSGGMLPATAGGGM